MSLSTLSPFSTIRLLSSPSFSYQIRIISLFLSRSNSFSIRLSMRIANALDLELTATRNIITTRYISFDYSRALSEKEISLRSLKWIRNSNVSNRRFRTRLALCSRKVVYLRSTDSNSCELSIIYVIASLSRVETSPLTRLLSIISQISRICELSIKRATIKFTERTLINSSFRIILIKVNC